MGCRLHTATEYTVRYSDGHFNHLSTQINLFIEELYNRLPKEKYPPIYFNNDFVDCADIIEVSKDAFKAMIDLLKSDYDENDCIIADWTVKEIICEFTELYKDSAENLDYIRLEWF
jgi:hypothetical protein